MGVGTSARCNCEAREGTRVCMQARAHSGIVCVQVGVHGATGQAHACASTSASVCTWVCMQAGVCCNYAIVCIHVQVRVCAAIMQAYGAIAQACGATAQACASAGRHTCLVQLRTYQSTSTCACKRTSASSWAHICTKVCKCMHNSVHTCTWWGNGNKQPPSDLSGSTRAVYCPRRAVQPAGGESIRQMAAI